MCVEISVFDTFECTRFSSFSCEFLLIFGLFCCNYSLVFVPCRCSHSPSVSVSVILSAIFHMFKVLCQGFARFSSQMATTIIFLMFISFYWLARKNESRSVNGDFVSWTCKLCHTHIETTAEIIIIKNKVCIHQALSKVETVRVLFFFIFWGQWIYPHRMKPHSQCIFRCTLTYRFLTRQHSQASLVTSSNVWTSSKTERWKINEELRLRN